MRSRNAMVQLATSWLGKNEKDGTHKEIIDIYNQYNPKPRGITMLYTWAWCACTWSALAIKLGYTDIIPIEISCGELIEAAKKMGCWKEADNYVPLPGDAVLYDWDDSGKGDNLGWPDHVGMVDYCNSESGYFTVIEGNYNDSVKKRTVSINGKFVRGFITPKYDAEITPAPVPSGTGKDVDTVARECIAGIWGNGETRKKNLAAAGFSYNMVQSRINEIVNGSAATAKNPEQDQSQPVNKRVDATCYAQRKDIGLSGSWKTTANLYLRNDAGTNKKALVLIPKGTKVQNYGFYSNANGAKWLLIEVVIDGVKYSGFSHSGYLTR